MAQCDGVGYTGVGDSKSERGCNANDRYFLERIDFGRNRFLHRIIKASRSEAVL